MGKRNQRIFIRITELAKLIEILQDKFFKFAGHNKNLPDK